MSYTYDDTDETIDVRDMIERFEELETELQDSIPGEDDDFSTYVQHQFADENAVLHDAAKEFIALQDILNELSGNGGDEQWRGDWYPIALIRDDYFPKVMDEMLEDCGDLPKDLPCYLTITVDYHALQQDYTSVEINGETYWYR